jgi:hypothetical protein
MDRDSVTTSNSSARPTNGSAARAADNSQKAKNHTGESSSDEISSSKKAAQALCRERAAESSTPRSASLLITQSLERLVDSHSNTKKTQDHAANPDFAHIGKTMTLLHQS